MKSYFEDKKGVMLLASIALVVLSIFLVVEIVNGIKTTKTIGSSAQNTIVATGQGEVSAAPDTAEFSFTVTETGTTVGEAQDKVAPKIKSAVDYLKTQGVEEKYIKTQGYNANPQYEYKPGVCTTNSCTGTQVVTGYEVSETVSVKVKDITKAGTLLGGVGSTGVSNISSLSFTIEMEDALKRQARQDAINKAQAQAEQLAKDLGVKLGKIVSFNESGNNPIYYSKTMGAADSMAVAPVAAEVPTGENKITSNVTITYEIK